MVLWILAAVLLAFWIIGLVLQVAGGFIHIALAVAVILGLVALFQGRTGRRTSTV